MGQYRATTGPGPTGPMLAASDQYWPGTGPYRHVYRAMVVMRLLCDFQKSHESLAKKCFNIVCRATLRPMYDVANSYRDIVAIEQMEDDLIEVIFDSRNDAGCLTIS